MIPLIIVGVLASLTLYTYTGSQYVSPDEAKKLIASGKVKVVLDVRTKFEYDSGHYPGAIHIPVNKINEKTTSILPNKGILVYCNTGQRARIAAEKLERLGYKQIYYIPGLYSSLLD